MCERRKSIPHFRELFASSISIYRKNFKLFFSMAVIFFVLDMPVIIYNFLSIKIMPSIVYVYGAFTTAIYVLVYMTWFFISLTRVILFHLRNEEQPTLEKALLSPVRDFGRIIRLFLILIGITILPIILLFIGLVGLMTVTRQVFRLSVANPLPSLILPTILTPVLYVISILFFAPTSAIVEENISRPISQNIRLVSGRFWPLVSKILPFVFIIQCIPLAIELLKKFYRAESIVNLVLNLIASFYGMLVFPLTVTFITLLYLKLKSLKASTEIDGQNLSSEAIL